MAEINKFAALKTYWSYFGLPAYEDSTVPELVPDGKGGLIKLVPPYITFEVATGSLDGVIPLSASVWYRGNSWAPVMEKVSSMEPFIDRQIKIEGGYLKVRRSITNFAQPMSDPSDDQIRRMRLNVEAEFLSY